MPEGTKDAYAVAEIWKDFGTSIDDLDPNAADGVADIMVDSNAPKTYYRLDGVNVVADALTPGIYIVRQGNTSKQVWIK